MDLEVPEIAGRDDDDGVLRTAPYDRYLTEVIGLLGHGGGGGGGEEEEDGAGSSGVVVDGGEITMLSPPHAVQSTWTTMTTTSTAAATASSGGDTPQLTELPEASAVVVGAGEAEMAAWLRQVLEEGSAPDRPADQPAAGGIRTISSSDDVRGAVAAAGKMPVKEKQQYHCPGCCRQPRSGGAGKRSGSGRAAEQRRRDKINEKLRALQRLVPFSNKSDQASTLDGVIQHIKYLQHQLQMMSNCSYSTAVQPYLQPAGGGGSVVAGRGWPPPPTTMLLRQQRQFVVPPPACRPPHHGD